MSTPLKSLLDFNREAYEKWHKRFAPIPNGIACPKCNAEMGDEARQTNTRVGVFGGDFLGPGQIKVICLSCGHKDVRFI